MLKTDDTFFLDFLRGLSALVVLVAHVQQILLNPIWMPFSLTEKNDILPFLYSQLGAFAVMIFFVLSGFLITYSIFLNFKNMQGGGFDHSLYFSKRMKRLYPPLLLSQGVVLFVFFVVYLCGDTNADFFATGKELYLARREIKFDAMDYFGSMFFLNTIVEGIKSPVLNGPLWSVAQEFWFYVLAGLLVMSIFNKKIIVLLLCVFDFLCWQGNSFFFYGLMVWLFGCIIAILHLLRFSEKNKYVVYALFVIALSAWLVLVVQADNLFFKNRQKFAFGIAFAFLMLILLESELFKGRLMAMWAARRIAKIAAYSYTLYLVHFPILIAIFIFTNKYTQQNWWLVVAVAAMSIVLVMWLSAKMATLVEKGFKEKIA